MDIEETVAIEGTFNAEEINTALLKMESNKTAGSGNLHIDFIQHDIIRTLQMLCIISVVCLKLETPCINRKIEIGVVIIGLLALYYLLENFTREF